MDKTGTFLLGAIAGAVALGVTAFLVDGFDNGKTAYPNFSIKDCEAEIDCSDGKNVDLQNNTD